ncbi:Cleavage and polyadenylation specificity factor subunit 5 [Monoraphidium neglectum]|uniref:Cleavage and polyadenylation specificity factor subunit 5 n=1 Tax=Monoraphidium neglectum TaxID=145388 RepID=A0A0D2KSV6_9CHLO|nr:Cleavage and polyadenylation specificity factor subunit 5 [Monoraphidium neglectum]KIY98598.1 Cleavage and polyadenylation specificity factor subunit 5 [Monoraphidium neglectum]|eukprot:XP_013897618.1 Cleavage and polyadenylation specificity factor subunit 5 [Monoraphidium neglectum]
MLRHTYAHAVYPVTGYKFGQKGAKPDKDGSAADRMARLKAKYEREGLRRSVDAVIVVQQHGHPHVLLLQLGNSNFFKLPGGKLKPGEDEVEGLKRKLVTYLSPEDPVLQMPWEIGECIGNWWRPNFDTVFYPYVPPHITRPKELKRLFVVPLLERSCFAVPKNFKLVAVPLFELYDNAPRFGPVMAGIPQMLCRLRLNIVGGAAAAKQAAAPQQPQQPQQQPSLQQQQQQQQQHYAAVGGGGGGTQYMETG